MKILRITLGIFIIILAIKAEEMPDVAERAEKSLVFLLEYIAENYFILGRSILVTYPERAVVYMKEPIRHLLPKVDNIFYIDVARDLLGALNEKLGWPTQTTETYTPTLMMRNDFDIDSDKHHSYILFVPPFEEEDPDEIADVVNNMIDDTSQLFANNPRGRYVVVIADQQIKSYPEVAMAVFKSIYKDYSVYDVLLVASSIKGSTEKDEDDEEKEGGENNESTDDDSNSNYENTFRLYTWFPFYENGQQATLLDQWIIGNVNSTLIQNENLFPPKLPPKGNSTVLRVEPVHNEPFLLYVGNHVDENGVKHYEFEGPEIYFLDIIAEHLNLILHYKLSEAKGVTYISRIKQAIYFVSLGLSDVGIGSLPLHADAIGLSKPRTRTS